MPFDLAAELHLKFDAVVVGCRNAMRQPGLATTDAIGHLASTHSSRSAGFSLGRGMPARLGTADACLLVS